MKQFWRMLKNRNSLFVPCFKSSSRQEPLFVKVATPSSQYSHFKWVAKQIPHFLDYLTTALFFDVLFCINCFRWTFWSVLSVALVIISLATGCSFFIWKCIYSNIYNNIDNWYDSKEFKLIDTLYYCGALFWGINFSIKSGCVKCHRKQLRQQLEPAVCWNMIDISFVINFYCNV